jgi:2-keto-4-pentenoate hydratase
MHQDYGNEVANDLADRLWQAAQTRQPCGPPREEAERRGWERSVAHAYAVQRINHRRREQLGARCVGRKIGLTSLAVQKQLGVDQPDFGGLWSDGAFGDSAELALSSLMQPKVESEVALVMGREVLQPDATLAEVIGAVAYALPAFEIVDSRIAAWNIQLFDTIADNASAGGFVLGADPRPLHALSLRDARMEMRQDDAVVSQGSGRACLGHPLNAAVWLARALVAQQDPLRAGDIVLTGALGPMVVATAGSSFEARIEGLGAVSVRFI